MRERKAEEAERGGGRVGEIFAGKEAGLRVGEGEGGKNNEI